MHKFRLLFMIIMSLVFFSSADFCSASWIDTGYATNITKTAATLNEYYYYNGDDTDEIGFVYGTSSRSILAGHSNVSPGGTGYDHYISHLAGAGYSFEEGSFSDDIINLSPLVNQATYYFRAYSHDRNGYYYGTEHNFTTLSKGWPTVYTYAATNIDYCTAVMNGYTDTGGTASELHGVVFGKSSVAQNPGNVAPESAGYSNVGRKAYGTAFSSGYFTFTTKTVVPNTTYYYRAFSQTPYGYGYGREYSFTTTSGLALPIVTTQAATNIVSDGATLNGTTDTSGTINEDHGFVFSKSSVPQNPGNIAPEYTDYPGFMLFDAAAFLRGSFSFTLEDRDPGTTYYFRAFSQTLGGYGYGDEYSFTTTGSALSSAPTAPSSLSVN